MAMIPRLYIRDVNDKAIATLDEGDYFDDTLTRYLAGKASVFEFSIYKQDGDYELFKAGKKVSFRYEDEDFWLSIMMTEQNETTLTITAGSLSLELNNEIAGPYNPPEAMSFADYLDAMINMDYTLEIGINEVSDKLIKHEWTGTSTLLARLFSLATVFDAELEFVTQLADNGGLDKIILNVYRAHSDQYQGLGLDRTSETFRFGSEITTVSKTEDISDIYTAIRPHGTDGLTIKDVEHEVLDDNGNILYATYKEPRRGFMDPSTLYAPQSRDLFPSTITGTTDKWIRKDTDELQYTSAEALYGYALGQLKQYSVPQTKWEISGYIDARIGDTIRVANDGYKPEIYLNARITEQIISFTDPTKNKSTFSNVVELKSEVNADLLKIVADMQEQINNIPAGKDGADAVLLTVSSVNGNMFKNTGVSTILTAVITVGGTIIDTVVKMHDYFGADAYLQWQIKKIGELEFTDIPLDDSRLSDEGFMLTVNVDDVDQKATFKCDLYY